MLDALLTRRLTAGRLTVEFPDGRKTDHGHGLPRAHWYFHQSATPGRIVRNPAFALGETYMDGEWSAGPGELPTLLKILMRNFSAYAQPLRGARALVGRLLNQWNHVRRSYRNVAHHYDLDEWLFRRFLDRDLHYSCAYFRTPDTDLDAAQQAKCEHLMHKLALKPNQHVLDIGSGWGSLALYLAEHAGVRVTGITLSAEQLRVAQARARERGLSERVQFLREDYREHRGLYDRIVSVGMFEHVGVPQYRTFFARLTRLLKDDGVAVLHTIGRLSPPSHTNPWIRRYIFPGGYIPALSEVARHIERARLVLGDLEILRLHYGYTLAAWQRRFQQHRAEVVARLGERFARMWEFYLAACEAAFEQDLCVFQFQFARSLNVLPITRDYLYLKQAETLERDPVAAARSGIPLDS